MQTHTPVGYWMEVPILDLFQWTELCHEIVDEMKQEEDAAWLEAKRNTP